MPTNEKSTPKEGIKEHRARRVKTKEGDGKLEPVKVGRTVIPIYRLKRRGFQARYYVAGVPKRLTCANEADLRALVEEKASGIETGRVQAGDLSAADVQGYYHAMAELQKLGPAAPPLHVALAEYVAAKAALPTGGTLAAAVAAYSRDHDATLSLPPAEILERFLLVLGDNVENPRHLRGRRHDLRRFVAWLPPEKRLHDVTSDEIQTYLRALMAGTMTDTWNGKAPAKGTWPPVGPRRRDNIRDAITELFGYARAQGYLPKDLATAAEKIKRLNRAHEIRYYTPEQLAAWLVHVKEEWIPWFVLCAFAGLRTSEVVGDPENPSRPRLCWEHFRWDKPHGGASAHVVVPATTARKIKRSRRAPLKENVLAWLKPWRLARGPLYPAGADQEKETDRLQKLLKIDWDSNALRHSHGTHRNAELGNAGQLAEEMGTSIAMIRKYYDAVPADVDAVAYYGIMPADSWGDIISFPRSGAAAR